MHFILVTMVNSLEFAKRLEKIIQYYGLSATGFAEKIAFNRSTISHLISGRNKPSLEFVMKVVKTFPEVELYWLLNGKGNFPPVETSSIEKMPEVQKQKTIVSTSVDVSSKNQKEVKSTKPTNHSSNIERIIIFYKNGSFSEYTP